MRSETHKAFVTATLALGFAAVSGWAEAEDTAGYADINGLHMYYEITGTGDPVVVLHGAYMSTVEMKPLSVELARSSACHGQTAGRRASGLIMRRWRFG